MNVRTRLERLESRVSVDPILSRHTPEALKRAEIARQRLPECNDAEEALRLTRNLPIETFTDLLTLVSNDVLVEMHTIEMHRTHEQARYWGYTLAQFEALPESKMLELHHATLGHRGRGRRRR